MVCRKYEKKRKKYSRKWKPDKCSLLKMYSYLLFY